MIKSAKPGLSAAISLLIAAAVLAGCSSASSPAAPNDSTVTQTVVHTTEVAPTYVPPPATTVAPLPPRATPAAGEREVSCPYIESMPTEDGAPNVGEINGDRVYRTTVVTNLKPVGCRFYFWSDPFHAVVDIVPSTFGSEADAYNAMVLTGQAGKDGFGQKGIVPGVDAVAYRTKFFGEDGDQDWACAFAKGKVMVVVHTDRTDTSLNAIELAKAIAPKF